MTKQSIKDYAVIVKDTPLELRKQLYKCLEDNDQVIYKKTGMNKGKRVYSTYFSFDRNNWCLTSDDMCKEVITIGEFLKLFDKQSVQIVPKYKLTSEDIVDKKVAIEVSSIEQINEINEHFKLSIIASTNYNHWLSTYKGDLCVNIERSHLEWCSKSWYLRSNYKVISFDEAVETVKPQTQESKYSIGSKFKNSVRTICTITKYNPKTKIYSYLSGTSTTEYTTSEANINKNWKLIPEPEVQQSVIANLQPGTKVRVRPDLSSDRYYKMSTSTKEDSASSGMIKLKGTIVTIKGLTQDGKYRIEEMGWGWTDEMFSEIIESSEESKVTIKKQSSYKAGDKVKIREDLNSHGNATSAMCKLAGTVVTITSPKGEVRNGYEFKEFGDYYWSSDMFEGLVIEETTQPKFKVGDLVELIPDYKQDSRYNSVTLRDFMINKIKPGTSRIISVQSNNVVHLSTGYSYGEDCLKLYEPKTDKKHIKHLAFFKESGEPWTEGELDLVRTYCEDTAPRAPMGPSTPNRKYAYSDENTDGSLKVYLWGDQDYPKKLEQISYESIFGTSTEEQTKTNVDKKTTKGAQTELIKQPKQIKKEEGTFMSRLKNTALATVEQNKEVAIIAAKMEAGRVLNKQVIKQIKPHVPMLLRGYLDTPLAPVILANAAAMLGNHTENKRVQKVAELMLLAAADTTVQSFNLDKIIDDVLSNIKLPAGILDADEE